MSIEAPLTRAEVKPKSPFMADNVYDTLKWVSLILLPALGTLYAGLAQFWGWPNALAVVGSLTLVSTFLGTSLQFATMSYNKSDASNVVGTIKIQENDDTKVYKMDLGDTDPSVIDRSGQVVFKVDSGN